MPLIIPTTTAGVTVLFDSGELAADGTLDSNNAGVIGGGGAFSTDFRTLLVLLECRDTTAVTAATAAVRFNNDSGTNYGFIFTQATNAVVSSPAPTTGATSLSCFLSTGTAAGANRFGATELMIPNYGSAAQKKTGLFTTGSIDTGGSNAFTRSGTIMYDVTTAISRVAVTAQQKAGSRLTILAF